MCKRPLIMILSASLLLNGQPLLASTPNDLKDLVDVRGRDGESEMLARGYRVHHSSADGDGVYTYWWNHNSERCVRILTADGRYQKIKNADYSDCNPYDTHQDHAKKDDKHSHTGVAVALGAAALLGVAALLSKSHQRDDRALDEQQTAQFERGYRDGLYNQPFHNYDKHTEYENGYTKGVEQRQHDTRYRTDRGSRGGNTAHVNVSDLNNRETTYAWSELERRGFSLANERQLGGKQRQWLYWNARTEQCVEVNSADTRVEYVGEASATACRK